MGDDKLFSTSTIGERIKAVRVKAGLPQHQFAKLLGYSTRALINWEQNAAEPPISILAEFRRRYDVAAEWVVMGEDTTPKSQYPQTDWERFERVGRDVDLICEQVGVELDAQTRSELIRDLFDDGPEAEEENRKQLRKMLRPSFRKE